eukprot:1191993-Amphidinium_carterae.2
MALNIDTLRLDCIRVGGPVTSYMGQAGRCWHLILRAPRLDDLSIWIAKWCEGLVEWSLRAVGL